ncbi:MAG TPA: alpha/beta hydrolase [Parvularculaceae bacterium]|nr:alpha/beta hydrolase [Amphiplicatus sp.]HOP18542.1 alpha/beta hydrolase [Amphiplicatus sp.]HPE29684.1 alpha/beta hydrolase [Parvularculaceae bacterium]HRX38329.1 alpha/beta hydrolase [Parvularculaceae bacterium]
MLRADRARLKNQPLELSERRRQFEERASLTPLAEDVSVSPSILGGVACETLTPDGAGEAPTLLYLHGGAYCLGSPKSHRELAGRLARAAGLRAVTPDYRLAPENPFPAALDDALSVYAAIAEETGAPPAAVCGDSAGGGLALALLLAARDRGLALPKCAAVISPWTDLTLSGESINARSKLDPFLAPDSLERSAAAYAAGRRLDDPLISPLFADLSVLPPLLIEVGSHEILFDDAARFTARAITAGVDARINVADSLFHVYHGFPMLPEAHEGTTRMASFLQQFC